MLEGWFDLLCAHHRDEMTLPSREDQQRIWAQWTRHRTSEELVLFDLWLQRWERPPLPWNCAMLDGGHCIVGGVIIRGWMAVGALWVQVCAVHTNRYTDDGGDWIKLCLNTKPYFELWAGDMIVPHAMPWGSDWRVYYLGTISEGAMEISGREMMSSMRHPLASLDEAG